jgi:glycosyltransferase involved in cell wall biosynthesis
LSTRAFHASFARRANVPGHKAMVDPSFACASNINELGRKSTRMLSNPRNAPHVVSVGVDLEPTSGTPSELIRVWDDFAHVEAAAAVDGSIRVSIVQASWYEEERRVEGVPCHFVREPKPTVRLPGGRAVRMLPLRLCARVRELAPDIIHFSGLGFSREVWALRAAIPGVPIIAQAHSDAMPDGWRRWYFRWGVEGLDAAIFCAREQGELFKRRGLVPRGLPLFEVIEVSTLFRPGDQRAARTQTGLDGDPCLFWLGNLDGNKDPLMVLDAVAFSAASLPDLRLHMAFRHAALLDAVRQRVSSDPTLSGRVALIGELPHSAVEKHLQAADFLVQGSHREGSGFGIIEALACGTTPLVTDIPSFRRITEQGRHGALIPAGDSRAMAREIVSWSGRDRAALRRSAREQFERELSYGAVGRQLRETYAQVRALRRGTRPKSARLHC